MVWPFNDYYHSSFEFAGDDVCGICRAPFDGCPPEAKYPGDDAPVVWGMCSHAFHIQCINKWLATQHPEQKCPFCRQPWEFKQADIVDERMSFGAPNEHMRQASNLLSDSPAVEQNNL